MKRLLVFVLFSFFFDGLFSTLITYEGVFLFKSFFSIVSLVLIYPYFMHNKKYHIIALITGLLFDIVYTNTLILNAVIFLLISIFIRLIFHVLQNKLLNGIIITILSIFLYNTITYLILVLFKENIYEYNVFLSKLIFILSINVFYFVVFYFLIKKISNKKMLIY